MKSLTKTKNYKKSISIIGDTLFVVAITLSSCDRDEEKDKENPASNTVIH